ncbi:hypothetical protein JCM16358_25580 [Halanaerocella petrolearia]
MNIQLCKSIKCKIWFWILVIIIVLSFSLINLSFILSHNVFKEITFKHGTENAQLSALAIRDWFAERKNDLQNYADNSILRKGSWQQKQYYLKEELINSLDIYDFFFVADKDGNYSTIQFKNIGNVKEEEYFKNAMQGQTYISKPLISKTTGKPIIVVAAPIKDSANKPIGVLGGAIKLTDLSTYVSQFKIDYFNSYAYLIGEEGEVLAHPSQINFKFNNHSARMKAINSKIKKKTSGMIKYNINDTANYIFYHTIVGTNNWKIALEMPGNYLTKPLVLANKKVWLIGLIIITLIAVLSFFITQKLTKPITKLKNVFAKGAAGDLSARAKIDSNNELGVVADSFNQIMEQINNLTCKDLLTDLLNLTYFQDKFDSDLRDIKETDKQLVLFALGVDDFDTINDNFGHQMGDEVLKSLANRLQKNLDDQVVIARFRDEFFFYFTEVGDQNKVINLGRRILAEIVRPYAIKEEMIYITASLGIATYPTAGTTSEMLIKNASLAMHVVKKRNGNDIQVYSANMEDKLSERMKLEVKLKQALKEEQFNLNYQPLLDAETEKIVGVEALIRWNHPIEGMISPGKFIPVAERTGIIVEIGDWVLKRSCEQLKKWHQLGYDDLYMSVNIAPQQFNEGDFVSKVEKVLHHTELEAQYLELEITERATMENIEQTIDILDQLQNLGVKIAIDDFGTGYSSLSYLKEFAINTLKIDQSFVMELTKDVKNIAIAETIITMAHNLNLTVTAEGVETEEQQEFLQQEDCDVLQGYLFSRPLDSENLIKLLNA